MLQPPRKQSFLEGRQPLSKLIPLRANNPQVNYLDRQGIVVSLAALDLQGNYIFSWLLLTVKAIVIFLGAGTQRNAYEQQKKNSQ